MTTPDIILLAAGLAGLILWVGFSPKARAILRACFRHPLRTTYLDADGNDVTEEVLAEQQEAERREAEQPAGRQPTGV